MDPDRSQHRTVDLSLTTYRNAVREQVGEEGGLYSIFGACGIWMLRGLRVLKILCVLGLAGVTGAEREMNTPGPCPRSHMASPRGACLPGRFPDTTLPSTKGYQCCVSGAAGSPFASLTSFLDFLCTEGGGAEVIPGCPGRCMGGYGGDRERLGSSTPGRAASPQALPSGPAASTRTPESVSPCSACTPWGGHSPGSPCG